MTGGYVLDQITLQFASVAAVCTFEILKKEKNHFLSKVSCRRKNFIKKVFVTSCWLSRLNGAPCWVRRHSPKMSISESRKIYSMSARRGLQTGWYRQIYKGLLCLHTWLGSCCKFICRGRSAKVLQLTRSQTGRPVTWFPLKITRPQKPSRHYFNQYFHNQQVSHCLCQCYAFLEI